MPKIHRKSGGFTLPEILIALSLITLITVVSLGALGPWLEFKQALDTDRKLNETREAIRSYYGAKAFAIEKGGPTTFGDFKTSTLTATQTCVEQGAAFTSLGFTISESGAKAALDGYSNAFCVFVGPQRAKAVDGVQLYYRTIAFVSTGPNAELDAGTELVAVDDSLKLAGDDRGVVVNVLDLALEKYAVTVGRMERVAQMYETYFTTRFLAAADRDLSRYYFNNIADLSGVVDSTGTNWLPVATALSTIGVSPDMGTTAWELSPDIQVNNQSGTFTDPNTGASRRPRTPATVPAGQLPYTALLRAEIPSPAGNQYIVRTAVGNY